MFGRGATTSTRRPRPRAVWAALVTSVVVCLLIVVGVLLPVLTLIGAADGGTAGALDVPVGSIAAAIAIGYVLALVLLLLVVAPRPNITSPSSRRGRRRRRPARRCRRRPRR